MLAAIFPPYFSLILLSTVWLVCRYLTTVFSSSFQEVRASEISAGCSCQLFKFNANTKLYLSDPALVRFSSETSPDTSCFFCCFLFSELHQYFLRGISVECAHPLGKCCFSCWKFHVGVWFVPVLHSTSPSKKKPDTLSLLKLKPREPTGVFFWQAEFSGTTSSESHQAWKKKKKKSKWLWWYRTGKNRSHISERLRAVKQSRPGCKFWTYGLKRWKGKKKKKTIFRSVQAVLVAPPPSPKDTGGRVVRAPRRANKNDSSLGRHYFNLLVSAGHAFHY